MSLITLQKITIQLGNRVFTSKSRKYIRIQITCTIFLIFFNIESTIIHTSKYAKYINQSCVQFQQSLSFLIQYDKEMDYEIYQKHQFGYNPQELSMIMYGKIMFSKNQQKFNNYQIFDSKNKKIGYLSVNIKTKPIIIPQILTNSMLSNNLQKNKTNLIHSMIMNQQKQHNVLCISSIVVSILKLKAKRAYALIKISEQIKRTTSSSISRTGELVFVDKYQIDIVHKQIDKKQQQNQLEEIKESQNSQNVLGFIEIYVKYHQQGKQDQKIAIAKIKAIDLKVQRKLIFTDDQNNNIGQGFIDAKIHKKSELQTQRLIMTMLKKSFNEKNNNLTNNTKKQLYQNQSTTRDLSKSNHSFILRYNTNKPSSHLTQFSLDSSRFRHNVSVVNHNQNIKIPQEKRFFTSRDPANNKCSYLPEQSFQFKEKRVGKYYRGASIGYGEKKDFAQEKKSLPGVGKYKLPSIWDRY